MSTAVSQTYQYLVVRFAKDTLQGSSTPVGLVYWQDQPHDLHVRLPEEGESIPGLNSDYSVFRDGFIQKLLSYLRTGTLPVGEATAYSDQWWDLLRRSFIHRFRLEGPRTVEVANPELDFELQFSAIVQPSVSAEREDVRIDSWISQALGPYKGYFETHQTIAGYEGRPVKVLKKATHGDRSIVFDAVNLTTTHAEREMEAMLHRAWELCKFADRGKLDILLGYYASPSGLNGEAKLVDLGEQIIGQPLLNLSNQNVVQSAIASKLGTRLPI